MNFREAREKTSIDFATILVGLPEVERKRERKRRGRRKAVDAFSISRSANWNDGDGGPSGSGDRSWLVISRFSFIWDYFSGRIGAWVTR